MKIGLAVKWTAAYFGIMLFYTFLDLTLWRKLFPEFSDWLNTLTIIICICIFLYLLQRTGWKLLLLKDVSVKGVLLAAGCAVLFFLLLDHGLDPFMESIFPASEQDYQKTVESLMKSPVTALIQVCVLAPFVEEVLMRGFLLGGLKEEYGVRTALLVTSLLFAILHFNMVQSVSAFICGMILGLLYLKTKSVLCCMIAHCGYNLISYMMIVGGISL